MATNPRFSVQPIGGKALEPNWQQNAPKRAAMAQAAYLHQLQNAWKQGNEGADPNVMRASRLSNHQPLNWNELTGQQ
jgi:hypothetical protein